MKKLIAIAAFSAALVGCSKVDIEHYQQIKVGMDKTEIETLLGSADKCEEKTLHTNCTWGGESKNISVTLVSDKVTLYSKKGF